MAAVGGPSTARKFRRAVSLSGLVFLALLYAFFGLNALGHHFPQGALAILGAATLGWGSARFVKGAPAAKVICLGTVPIALLHATVTVVDSREPIGYLLASLPVPGVAGAIWRVHR